MATILGNVYKQYKDDTELIAGWLAEESLKCGYDLTTNRGPVHNVTGRLKGKARKQVPQLPYHLAVQHIDQVPRQEALWRTGPAVLLAI